MVRVLKFAVWRQFLISEGGPPFSRNSGSRGQYDESKQGRERLRRERRDYPLRSLVGRGL